MSTNPAMIVIADPTGAELLDAIRSAAITRGVTALDLARELSPYPTAWLRQLGAAVRPKPLTVARVRAVIAGEQPPAEVPDGLPSASPRTHSERIVLAALTEAAETGAACPSNTALAALLSSGKAWSAGDVVKRLEGRRLITVERFKNSRRVTIVASGCSTADSGESSPHPTASKQAETCAAGSTVQVPAAVAPPRAATQTGRVPPAVGFDNDRRPIALSREACPFCNVRGDLGCKHQRPFESARAIAAR